MEKIQPEKIILIGSDEDCELARNQLGGQYQIVAANHRQSSLLVSVRADIMVMDMLSFFRQYYPRFDSEARIAYILKYLQGQYTKVLADGMAKEFVLLFEGDYFARVFRKNLQMVEKYQITFGQIRSPLKKGDQKSLPEKDYRLLLADLYPKEP
jgi:hypothetical protein